jgi:hypothetical protein
VPGSVNRSDSCSEEIECSVGLESFSALGQKTVIDNPRAGVEQWFAQGMYSEEVMMILFDSMRFGS